MFSLFELTNSHSLVEHSFIKTFGNSSGERKRNAYLSRFRMFHGDKEMNLEDIFRTGSLIKKLQNNVRMSINNNRLFARGEIGFTSVIHDVLLLLQKHSISSQSIKEMKEAIEYLNENYQDYSSEGLLKKIISDGKYHLTVDDAKKILTKVNIWGDRIINELRSTIIFPAYTTGDLNPKKLINGAENFFNAKIWQNIAQIAKDDLEDCVKCLLTENWTPAGIMAMRVIESAVRKYYKDIVGINKKKPWGILLADLIKNHEAKTDKNLIAELTYIKDHMRNPLAHPELRIEKAEAEKAFILTKEILVKIYT